MPVRTRQTAIQSAMLEQFTIAQSSDFIGNSDAFNASQLATPLVELLSYAKSTATEKTSQFKIVQHNGKKALQPSKTGRTLMTFSSQWAALANSRNIDRGHHPAMDIALAAMEPRIAFLRNGHQYLFEWAACEPQSLHDLLIAIVRDIKQGMGSSSGALRIYNFQHLIDDSALQIRRGFKTGRGRHIEAFVQQLELRLSATDASLSIEQTIRKLLQCARDWRERISTQLGNALLATAWRLFNFSDGYGIHVALLLSGPNPEEWTSILQHLHSEWCECCSHQAQLLDTCGAHSPFEYRGMSPQLAMKYPMMERFYNLSFFFARTAPYIHCIWPMELPFAGINTSEGTLRIALNFKPSPSMQPTPYFNMVNSVQPSWLQPTYPPIQF